MVGGPRLDVTPGGKDDLTDKKFGYWTVIELSHRDENSHLYWKCQCGKCGDIYNVWDASLKRGDSSGCKRCRSGTKSRKRSIGR